MIPRLRMLAGPNGSGKSTLAQQLADDYAVNLYKFLNADMLFAEISRSRKTACPFSIDNRELLAFVNSSTYPEHCKKPFRERLIAIDEEDYLIFLPEAINSYTVAMTADFFKEEYLNHHLSFSFETVFSHPAKVDILRKAHEEGFRTYMYFIATENPDINMRRIQQRVKWGGHDVPAEKTIARYYRCLEQVPHALPHLDRAYFFDNSGDHSFFFAEYERGKGFQLYTPSVPNWFKRFVVAE